MRPFRAAQYRRLAGRRGKKRAIVAVGHTMLVMMYHMLKEGMDYQELGHDYLDKLEPQRLTRYLVKRLQSLGHEVTLRPVDQARRGIFRAVTRAAPAVSSTLSSDRKDSVEEINSAQHPQPGWRMNHARILPLSTHSSFPLYFVHDSLRQDGPLRRSSGASV